MQIADFRLLIYLLTTCLNIVTYLIISYVFNKFFLNASFLFINYDNDLPLADYYESQFASLH